MAKSKSADYKSTFARTLRELLEKHPVTGVRTTYNILSAELKVKPQSISQWANGDTTPDMKHIVPLAKYFGVDANFLLTGVSAENQTMWQDLGLHENSVRFLKDLKNLGDKGEIHSIAQLMITDIFFRSGALTNFYAMINHYVYDVLENTEAFEKAKAELMEILKDEEQRKDSDKVYAASAKVKTLEDNAQFLWYKSAYKAREVMNAMIEKAGGFEKFNEICFQNRGRFVPVDSELMELFKDSDEGYIGDGKVIRISAELSAYLVEE